MGTPVYWDIRVLVIIVLKMNENSLSTNSVTCMNYFVGPIYFSVQEAFDRLCALLPTTIAGRVMVLIEPFVDAAYRRDCLVYVRQVTHLHGHEPNSRESPLFMRTQFKSRTIDPRFFLRDCAVLREKRKDGPWARPREDRPRQGPNSRRAFTSHWLRNALITKNYGHVRWCFDCDSI